MRKHDSSARISAPQGNQGTRPIRIAIDTLGGDAEPETLVRGALDWARDRSRENAEAVLVFFGDAQRIAPLIRGTGHEAVHEPRCLAVDDPLRETLRGSMCSSLRSSIASVAYGEADAVVSAGSTGALMAVSRHLLGMLPGVRRPAIIKTLAGEQREFRMLDLGANIGAQPAQLHQFARMGEVAASTVDRVVEPTVALLNIGSEVNKGPAEVRAAARLLDADERLRYVGFVEPDRLFRAGADIVVADGFAGNIALKSAEGAVRMARFMLGRELAGASPRLALVKALAGGPLTRLGQAYNPQRYNGAVLLGLSGVVVKSHGSADRQGFHSALAQAANALDTGLVDKLAAGI